MKNSPKVEEARREAHECCPFTRDPYDGQTCEMPDGPMLTRCEELHDAIDKQANLIAVVQADCNKDASGPHPPEAEQPQVCVNPSVHPQPCQVCGPVEQPQVGHVANCRCRGVSGCQYEGCCHPYTDPRCKPGLLMLAEARLEILLAIDASTLTALHDHHRTAIEQSRAEVERLRK